MKIIRERSNYQVGLMRSQRKLYKNKESNVCVHIGKSERVKYFIIERTDGFYYSKPRLKAMN